MIYEKFEPKNDAKVHMKNARACAALVREAPKPHRPVPISRRKFDVKNKENKDTPRNVNELATRKKIVMIYEKFEPKNYAKARMKIARLGAALVREAPKPQRPLLLPRAPAWSS